MHVLNFITRYRMKKLFCQGDPGLTRSAVTPKATNSGHRGLKKGPAGAGWALAAEPRGGGKEDPPKELHCAPPETTRWSETVFRWKLLPPPAVKTRRKSRSCQESHSEIPEGLSSLLLPATGSPDNKPGVSVTPL